MCIASSRIFYTRDFRIPFSLTTGQAHLNPRKQRASKRNVCFETRHKYTQQKSSKKKVQFFSEILHNIRQSKSIAWQAGGCLVHFDTKLEGLG